MKHPVIPNLEERKKQLEQEIKGMTCHPYLKSCPEIFEQLEEIKKELVKISELIGELNSQLLKRQ